MDPWSATPAPVAEVFALEKYPPGFPFLVAVAGGAYDWRIAHAIVAIAFAIGIGLAGWHARNVTGSKLAAFACAATLALLPGAWINLKGILSDFPYLALSLAALVLHARIERGTRGGGAWLALAAVLAAVLLTRTIGVALVAAVAVHELRRLRREHGDWRGAALAVAFPLACAGLWYLLRPAGGQDTYVAGGQGLLRGTLDHGPGWLARSALANASALAFSWRNDLIVFWDSPWQGKSILAAVLGVLALAGTVCRAARGTADGLYAAFYLAILLAWPFPAHMYRLGLPLIPVVLPAGWWLLERLLARAPTVRGARPAALAAWLPVVLCAPATLIYVGGRATAPGEPLGSYHRSDIAEYYRITLGPWAASVAEREIAVLRDLERIGAQTPPGARIAWYLPDYVALLAGRPAAAIPAVRDPHAFAAALRASAPDYLYVTAIPLRDEGTGGDDPLAPLRLAAPYSELAWTRGAGKPEAALLRIDHARLEAYGSP
jgi:hypothetical protein